ncbi:ATP-dependent DNA helicase RecG [Wansuia hejianensis]|uniref:ATP-dependent DNA helicase RecG n=1 Tax=Wansuia hejianensis TaxID=2763667 RepID=A0A926F211_9FIRM|nr:ATP-dependent DNA helicase RecG [Wansuia hejianensis]MBC8590469.1 ATP-dependent DNA helicase RecG [Wansuia hejianensis]
MDNLSMNIQYVKGVGPKRASRLNKLNIKTIYDLLYFFPREYEDRSQFNTILNTPIGEKASLDIEIVGPSKVLRPRRNMSILKVPFKDSSGYGYLVWFNQEYLKDNFNIGEKLKVNGKINKIGMEYQVMNPVFEKNSTDNKVGRILPIYPLTKGLSNNEVIKIMKSALNHYLEYVEESLPRDIIEKYKLMEKVNAIKNIHFPSNKENLLDAKRRLIFEELLVLQLGLFIIKNKSYLNNKGIKFESVGEIDEFIKALPFTLTQSQKNVFKEIQDDMDRPIQMNRLVQGDVGSGKTIIAALAMFRCVKSGYQAAMMAPTEILATQHYESLSKLFSKWNINCKLLTGSLTQKKKTEILQKLKDGDIDIIIGTHAIIQENIEFYNLGLAITDEQHRFGVKQRAILNQKGNNPDMLVMTATPIPRTLALILYGDLDISIIDELPPGRKEIETYAVGPEMIDRINKFIEKQILEGRQAYIVCPLIEDSESISLNSAEELYTILSNTTFKNFNVGLLHGKMNPKEKDEIMEKFKEHKLDILVSTTVIEVGVNVPNSNIMVVYNAERFGLAQLHQLRGRVGRGEYQSYCILLNYGKNKIARERMRILQSSSDGFVISEKDLELRGPGEFFGTKQHGLPELKIANLFSDITILKLVQKEALKIMDMDKNLQSSKYKVLRSQILDMFKNLGDDLILN